MNNQWLCLILTTTLGLAGCGSSRDKTSSDTEGDTRFRVTLNTSWNATDYPTNYPSNAHWSPLSGTVHNEQIVFWEANGQPSTSGIESMAETGSTGALSTEINVGKNAGYSQGLIKTSSIGQGTGSTSIEFLTNESYPLLTLVSMIAPSPDWFVGVNSLSLLDNNGDWIDSQTINLELFDAGTDAGLRFTSANDESNQLSLPITLASSERSDSDFENGVNHSSETYVGTLVIERI